MQSPTSLIPRSLFFGNPSRSGAKISPDGTSLSFLAPVEGVMNIWVGLREDWQSARPITFDKGRGITNYGWSPSGTHLVYMQDQGGDENWRLYSLDLATQKVTPLSPFVGARVGFFKLSPKHPNECVFGSNARNKQFNDIWKVNISTGELSFVLQNDQFGEIFVDNEFNARAALNDLPDGGIQVSRRDADGQWSPVLKLLPEDSLSTEMIGMTDDGQLLGASSAGRDTTALVSIDLETGTETMLGLDPQADIENCLRHPLSQHPLAYSTNRLKRKWQVLDEELAADFELLHSLSGDFNIESQTLDNRTWVVLNNRADRPGTYLLFNRDSKQLTELFSIRPDLEGLPLREMHAVEIPARDGLPLVSYYTLPEESGADSAGRPSQPVPMVLMVHGGPWARDAYGYHPVHQWLANRGYAVLGVNYRGSTGFGKNFVNAANHQFAGAMHDDLIDAVDWAIEQGITNRDTVAIFGGSYGGYATLVGVTFTPDRFAAGIDLVGPSNLVTLIESFPEYWKPLLEGSWFSRVGNPEIPEHRERLLAQSPISRVQDIRSPLLIGQGANDPRVVQAESDQIVKVMEESNLPVTYVLFPDEGHGFARPENKLAFYSVMESFLGKVFGKDAEPIDGSFEGSSIQVPNGSSYVPKLDEALTGHKPAIRH
jgi:dipeptidyl aminopeptidase/acylaminoacyl peptidase